MAVATYEDVAIAIGRPISDSAEQARVEYWLNAVEIIIGARLGDVTELDQDGLKFVETEAVATRLSNPEGYQSESIDDYTYRFGADTRGIVIRDEWWQILDPDVGANVFSFRPTFEADEVQWPVSTPPYLSPLEDWH